MSTLPDLSTEVAPLTLPGTLYELGRLALDDLEQIEGDERYKIHMEHWHVPGVFCQVCLAGAVIAKTLGAGPDELLGPYDYDEPIKSRLLAIHFLRSGKLNEALHALGREDRVSEGQEETLRVSPYEHDPELFKEGIEVLIAFCRAKNW